MVPKSCGREKYWVLVKNIQLWYEYMMARTKLEAVEFEKDVGVLVHQSLKPSMQCARAAARANGILGQLFSATVTRTPSSSSTRCT